jgi:hypothetical protein
MLGCFSSAEHTLTDQAQAQVSGNGDEDFTYLFAIGTVH